MVRLLDGSMWAQLKQFGYDCDDSKNKPHWTFPANRDCNLIEKVYKSFLDIGVNIISTNTYHFGSTLDENLPKNAENKELYQKYFENACSTLCDTVQTYNGVEVWGSVGSFATMYHDCSEYTGAHMDNGNSKIAAYNYYKTIFDLFQTKTKIRNVVFETISSALEGEVALAVLEEYKEMRAVMSFTYKENACLRHGEKVSSIAEKLSESAHIIGIGINCTDPENVLLVLKEIKKYNFSEIFVYPNMGDSKFLSEGSDDSNVFNQQMVFSWVKEGATAIGGCCGVSETQMRILKQLVDKANSQQLL